jgi:hypothetical protein
MASSPSSRALLWLAVPAIATVSITAQAQPTPQQKELARDLMQKGYAARTAHDFKQALESFKGAEDIMHVPTTGFEFGRAQVDVGQLVEAHETLIGVMRMPERPEEPQAFHDARGYAKTLDDEILPRIPQIRIVVTGAAPGQTATVTVDGTSLPASALLVPYKVDPGHHVITAKTEGAEGRAETDVAERETKDVSVPLTASAQPATPVPNEAAQPGPEASTSTAPEAPSGGHGPGVLGWTGFGVAAVGVVAGSITGVMTLSDKSSIAKQCNGTRCPPSTYSDLSTANTLATVSTISFIAAGVGAGVGITAWLLGSSDPAPAPAPATGLRVTPYIGVGAVGASGTF